MTENSIEYSVALLQFSIYTIQVKRTLKLGDPLLASKHKMFDQSQKNNNYKKKKKKKKTNKKTPKKQTNPPPQKKKKQKTKKKTTKHAVPDFCFSFLEHWLIFKTTIKN